MNIFFWRKSAAEVTVDPDAAPKGYVKYEEIDAKRTSKLGYFFLVMMVIFGVWQGNVFISALDQALIKPASNSDCFYRVARLSPGFAPTYSVDGSYSVPGGYFGEYSSYNAGAASLCNFSAREQAHGFPMVYTTFQTPLLRLESLQKQLSEVENDMYRVRSVRSDARDEYSVSLLETIASKNNVIAADGLRETLVDTASVLSTLSTKESSIKQEMASVNSSLTALALAQVELFETIDNQYVHDVRVYRFKQFILSFVSILLLFILVFRQYMKLKNKNSEYTLIWGGAVAVASIMLTQILISFIYSVIPHRLLEQILSFLSHFEFLIALVYWLGFVLIPAFFGFLIYIIQKKYYNRRAVIMRAFKANKCPTCTMSVAPHMVFCPACGTGLKVKCVSCGQNTPNAGDFCELCGTHKDIQ